MAHFYAKQMNIRSQRGFSLIEALFSALILGVALLGLAGFHAVALQDGSQAKARSVAANLALEKLDDLRSFTRLEGDATACGAGTFCFSEIASDAGGQEVDAGGLILPAGTVAGYIDNYSLAWTVTCSTETAGTALSFGSTCTDAAAKLATVTTTWTDSKGVSQSVSLQGVIYAMDPSKMALAASPANSNQLPPKPSYTPVGVPDAVPVPINTGGTQFKESSKPLPEVSQSGTGIEVSFDSVVYSSVTGGYEQDSVEEFSTVGCECQFVSGTASGYTPTRKVWNGQALENLAGEEVDKVTGAPLGINPPEHCDICCRDHHDRTADEAKYDPQRPDSDYTAGDHKHYWYSQCVGQPNCTDANKNASLASATPFTAVTTGPYLEACRVARVDGFWRVQQDWKLRKVTILPYDFLLTDTNLTNYVNLVEEVVEDAVKFDSTGTGLGGFTALPGRDLTLASGADPVQLLSRAVYVDTIYSKDNPDTVDSDYYSALMTKLSASQAAGNSAWLEYAPFYEANLTLLYDWTSSDPTIATASSEHIDAIVDPVNDYYGSFSRGKVTIQSGTTAGSSTITAKARLSNSGVTGGVNLTVNTSATTYVPGVSYGTDLLDNGPTLIDTITVSRLSGDTQYHSITGKVTKGNSSVNVNETGTPSTPIRVELVTDTGAVISPCTAQTGDPDANGWYYTCTVSDGWTGNVRITSADTVYTFGDSTTTTWSATSGAGTSTPPFTVGSALSIDPIAAYGGSVTITGYVIEENTNITNLKPDVTAANTTITFVGTTNGTCTDKQDLSAANLDVIRYTCVVPKGWTGNVVANATSGVHYYYSYPSGAACPVASQSCMATITDALADIDGTSASATNLMKSQTSIWIAR